MGVPSPSDRELIEAAKRGDVDAFEVLYLRYRDWVVSVAYRFSGHDDDALDVLQETFAYVLRKLPDLELHAQMRTFLYPAVKHLALSRRRASRRHQRLEVADDVAQPEAEREDDGHAELAKRIATLPEPQREVVWLRFADDLDLKEIAATLDVPLGTVKSRLHHALEKLRRQAASER